MGMAEPSSEAHEFGQLGWGKVLRECAMHGQDNDGLFHLNSPSAKGFDDDFEGSTGFGHEFETEACFSERQPVSDHVLDLDSPIS